MTRNAEQNQRMRDERREKILHHALKLFASKGLVATKINDIASDAQMSQGLLYHYFHSKEEIFIELIRDAFDKMNTAALGLEEAPMKPCEKIYQALLQLVKGIEQSEDFASTVLMIAQAGISDATPDEAQEIIRRESNVPYEVVERILQAGQQEGTIKQHDPKELSMIFWTTIKGLALHKAVNGSDFKAPDVRLLTSLFFVDRCD